MTEIEYILNQKKDIDIIELFGTMIWNKVNAHKTFQNLSEPELTFVCIDIFESEIKRDGFYGFFYNTSGEYAHEVLEAYHAIHANETVNIVDEALRLFPELPVPKDIILRRKFIDTLEIADLEAWSNLELELVNSKEDIVDLIITYIRRNKSKVRGQ